MCYDNTTEKIVVCPICKGLGKKEVTVPGLHEDYWYEETCDKCKGFGRLIEVVTVKYKPLKKTDLEIIRTAEQAQAINRLVRDLKRREARRER